MYEYFNKSISTFISLNRPVFVFFKNYFCYKVNKFCCLDDNTNLTTKVRLL